MSNGKTWHITLIRHGTAGDAGRDEDRCLTRIGRHEAAKLGRRLLRTGSRFDAIISSPLVRALQTAEIVASRMHHAGAFLVDRRLEPERPPAALVELLREMPSGRRFALVSHEPIMSSLAARLLGHSLGRALVKSEALRIRMPDGLDGHGQWRWSMDPVAGKSKHPG